MSRPTTSLVSRLLAAAGLDLGIAVRHVVLNVVAGSVLLPRPLRRLVYLLAGVDARTSNVFPGVRLTGTALSLGEQTFLNHDCYLDVGKGRIDIGARCHLAPAVMVLTATHDLAAADRRAERYLTTTIEDDVWLGARATVLPGVTIGRGCVVAAGAVVTEDCAPGGLYAGVPARRVRDLAPAAPSAPSEAVLAGGRA
ncbi:acyltransferase [Nocardioides panacisoli]|uniref:acyltransferase n=1 Tax=Nocardioides panacisoli TaxID=627624 RepID=UPI001C6255E8|nr:acyltransferase [Nocardioides panacisoli]QYJ02979.1 acyltransferase [Nocardioides panacisoli]